MTLDELKALAEQGDVDTVVLALCDMQGRLMGKRLTARHFVDEVAEHGAEGCNYLLAVDVDMNTVEGYDMASWSRGYGDFVLKPDMDTLRPLPWLAGTVMLMADVAWEDGSDVVASPRQILRRQLARLAERGWNAVAGTELEFIVFRDTYEEAWHKAYRGLEPANLYNVDYSVLGTSRVEPLLRAIRNHMEAAGMQVEDSKGECNLGQHEINFRYGPALRKADEHSIYKNAAKEIASQQGCAITYMAKFDAREGSSCHIHFSLLAEDGAPVFARDQALFERFVAGQLACLRELTLFFAPNVNSYKRFAAGSFAPTAVAWGKDNRTCSIRVVGHGGGLRFENRLPGADVNPYLAIAAMIAAGLHGIDAALELEPPVEGNAYVADKPHVPKTLQAARELFAGSLVAREAFGSRGGRPLPQHGRRRARSVRSGGDRLGALPRVRAAVTRETLRVIEPATEAVLASVPRAGVEEADAAVARAAAAYPAWRAIAPADRAKLLHRLADAISAVVEELALLEARNAGKPICRRARRDGHGARHVSLLRGRAGADARRHDPRRRRAGVHRARAARRRRTDHAVELPADDRRVEDGAGAGRREHDRAEARRAHAADRLALRAAGFRGPAPGCGERGRGPGADRRVAPRLTP